MVNFMKRFMIAVIIVLILIFALASVIDPQWMSSTVFMILYLIFALSLLISAFSIPGIFLKLMHLLLAILIISFVMLRVINERTSYTFAKGVDYQLIADEDTLSIKLMNCDIRKSQDKRVADNYISDILVNGEEFQISLDQSFSYKRGRFYHHGHDSSTAFIFAAGTDSLKLFPGQSADLLDQRIQFHDYDDIKGKVAVSVDAGLHLIPIADKSAMFYAFPAETVEASILEYVEVKGHVFLFITAFLALILLIFVRFRSL